MLFFGWIGGLAAWWKNKKQAPQASRYLLFGGIGWSAVQGFLAVILVAVLIITPAVKAGFKWPFTAVKPASVSQESQWIEGDPTGKTGPQRHYVPPPVKRTETGTILTDTPVELATTQIDTSGGTINVDKPGDPLNGLQITVPANAYSDNRTFKVSSAPIKMNTFGNGVNPISPMISVENGGGLSATPMILKVPLQVPEGQVVTWYYYDSKTGTLEGAPVIAVDKDSATVALKHFTDGFFSSLAAALIPRVMDSGFRPGTDSWQFENPTTYVSNGICEGMSMGAMWYYLTKPDGSDKSLFGRYDNNGKPNPPTVGFDKDDALAIRFCSLLHEDYMNHKPEIQVWNPNAGAGKGAAENQTTRDWWVKLQETNGDNLTRRLFETSMLATHEPQMVFIYNLGGPGGHAMMVYKITDGTLFIYDPNIPGGVGQIMWENGKYLPYMGFGTPWGDITYVAKSTIISNWDKIAGFWSQLKDGTIGNGVFPSYKVNVIDDKGDEIELSDDYETTDGSLDLKIDNPQLKFDVYYADPLFKDSPAKLDVRSDGKYYLTNPGESMVGIDVTDQNDAWVDFKWFKVKNGYADAEVKIEAPGKQGYVDDPCTFKALTKNMSKDTKLEWYFYGNAGEQGTKYSDADSVTHTFKTSGEKTITCQVVKDKAVKPLAKDTVTYEVIEAPLDIIANPSKGAVKQTCTFQLARSNPLPEDAKYSWSFGNGKSGQGEEASTIYDEAKTYTVSVTATWVTTTNGGPVQEHTYGEIKYEVADTLPLRILADPAKATAGEKTSFSVQGDNIPDNAAFYWEFGDANSEGNVSSPQQDGSASHTYTKEGTYDIKVSMLDRKNPQPLAQATLRYNVEPPISLAIAAPDEILRGKGVTDKHYTFKSSWEPGKAPDGVTYTWSFAGKIIGSDADRTASFDLGHYKFELKAQWKDIRGLDREVAAPPLDFDITVQSAFVIVATDNNLQRSNAGVIDKEYTFTTDWSPKNAPAGVSYVWTVDGDGVEDQGGKIHYTFKTEGSHTVTASAAWKDDKGNAQTADNNRILTLSVAAVHVQLTCTDGSIQNNKLGVPKKDYTFNVSWDSGKAPAGVKYKWYLDQQDTGRTGTTETFNFKDENDYAVLVHADWSTPAGKAEWNQDEIDFTIESPTNFSVRCADSALQGSHKGVPDKDYKFYAYWGEGSSAPEGTTYAWSLNGDDTGDTGDAISMPLSADPSGASKSYTVKATAKWTDKAGNAKSASSDIKFDIGSAPTLSINVPDEIASGKGVTNKQYSFSADPQNIPSGADYTWYSGGAAKKHGKDLKSVTNTFTSATNYVLKVEAKWTDADGKTQSVASPEVEFEIAGVASITLNAPADIKANKGIKGQKYLFSVTTTDIPEGAEYTWYSNGDEKTSGKDQKTGNISFSEAIDYTLKVEATWTDSGKEQSATSPAVSFHINAAAYLSIVPPGDLAGGRGVPEKGYTFSAQPQGIPNDAEYTWSVNDKLLGKSGYNKSPLVKTDKDPGDYTVKVVATWKANNQSQQVDATYKFTTQTGVDLTNGAFGSGMANGKPDDKLGPVLLGPVFAKTIISVAGGKATANQSVPFTIQAEEGSTLSGNAKIKVDGTDNKGVLTGTYSFNSVINYVSEGKTVPIDITYAGTFKSEAIPVNPANTRVTVTFTGYIQSHALVKMIAEAGAACAQELDTELGGTPSTTEYKPPENDVLCPAYVSNVDFTASVSGQ